MLWQATANGLLLGGLYGIATIGFSMVWGVMGVINLAHTGFIMLGAYITYGLFRFAGLDPIASIPVSMVAMFALGYALQDSRDLPAFFEKYRHVAGSVLAPELDRLLVDLQTGNQEEALRRMDARLGLPSFSSLCAILCGVHQGIDQRLSLLVLEQDMRTKERETLRRNMEKRPGRIKAASLLLTVLMIFMFMIPLVLLIVNSLRTVGF